jgi:hypothetical protein
LGLVALDGTKIEANAAAAANRTHAHLQTQLAELLPKQPQRLWVAPAKIIPLG